ncbi:MAG: hypothetical protein P8X55_10995 [Desulfosarcinaceae bacterium]
MGFYYTPPRYGDVSLAIENIDLLSVRSEIATIHEELPWDLLLDGVTGMDEILAGKEDLIAYLRSKGLDLFFMADLTDGLSRGEEPPILRGLGRSITEAFVRQRYRDYVLAFVQRFDPNYIGLTAETNLVRQAADPAVYNAVVQAANAAAGDLAAAGATAPLLISVQVETAWGVLTGAGPYEGIAQDLVDFPFVQILGLSSYPYFGYSQPEDIPDNYYSRLLNGRSLPVMVCEGGWPSASFATVVSSPQLQARYITRQADLLDSVQARAVIQTLFTDIDLDSVPQPYPAILPLFTTLGLMSLEGDDFIAKPALDEWDHLYSRSLD